MGKEEAPPIRLDVLFNKSDFIGAMASGHTGIGEKEPPDDKTKEMEYTNDSFKRTNDEISTDDEEPRGDSRQPKRRHGSPADDDQTEEEQTTDGSLTTSPDSNPSAAKSPTTPLPLNTNLHPHDGNNNPNSHKHIHSQASHIVVEIQLNSNTPQNDFGDQEALFLAMNSSPFANLFKVDSLFVARNKKSFRFETKIPSVGLDKIANLGNWNVRCHQPLSDAFRDCSWGVITGVDLKFDNDKILSNLRTESITLGNYLNNPTIKLVERIKKKNGTPTSAIRIVFEGELPKAVKLFYTHHAVKPYNFDLYTCKNCKQYGHLKNKCKNAWKCRKCSGEHNWSKEEKDLPTPTYKCKRNPYGLHCKGNHAPFDKKCEVHKKALRINKANTMPNNLEIKRELKALNRDPQGYNFVQREQEFQESFPDITHSSFPPLKSNPNNLTHTKNPKMNGTQNQTEEGESQNNSQEEDGEEWRTINRKSRRNTNHSTLSLTPGQKYTYNPTNNTIQEADLNDLDLMPFSITPASPIHGTQPIQYEAKKGRQTGFWPTEESTDLRHKSQAQSFNSGAIQKENINSQAHHVKKMKDPPISKERRDELIDKIKNRMINALHKALDDFVNGKKEQIIFSLIPEAIILIQEITILSKICLDNITEKYNCNIQSNSQ